MVFQGQANAPYTADGSFQARAGDSADQTLLITTLSTLGSGTGKGNQMYQVSGGFNWPWKQPGSKVELDLCDYHNTNVA